MFCKRQLLFGKVLLAVLVGNVKPSTWVAREEFPVPVSDGSMDRCVEA